MPARRWHEAARLPDPGLSVRGIAADLDSRNLIVTTDHGMYRSLDAGRTWQLEESSFQRAMKMGFIYESSIPVARPGFYEVRVVLRDTNTSRLGSAREYVERHFNRDEQAQQLAIILEDVNRWTAAS